MISQWEKNSRLLNDIQRKAVEAVDKPVLVLAGAGSGKTRVITFKVAYLLLIEKILPSDILCVTFTNKAAREMRERIERDFGLYSGKMWIATFHSACLRMLRQKHALARLGYKETVSILDAADQLKTIRKALNILGIDPKTQKDYDPKTVLAIIRRMKRQIFLPEQQKEVFFLTVNYKAENYYHIFEQYQILLRQNGAFDFDDLLLKTYQMLMLFPDLAEYWQSRFQYVMVDEFQDTNQLQYAIMKKLVQKHRRVTVVGDDDQAIYSWRGASVEHFGHFQKDFHEHQLIKLEQNYRSYEEILQTANDVSSSIQNRIGKSLWTLKKNGPQPVMICCQDDREEADFIVSEIIKLMEQGVKSRDIAIFYRTNWQSRIFEQKLREYNIGYQLIGAFQFFERREIKLLIHYLKFIQNPDNRISFEYFVNQPKRGIGPSTLNKFYDYLELHHLSLLDFEKCWEQLKISRKAKDRLYDLLCLIRDLHQLSGHKNVQIIAEELLRRINYKEFVQDELSDSESDAESRMENVFEFCSMIQQKVEENSSLMLIDFMNDVSLQSSSDEIKNNENLLLLTIHCSKGLEFEAVFVSGLEEGLLPHHRTMDNYEGYEEEKRLFYVAITRAKRYLYLTWTQSRWMFGKRNYSILSSFVDSAFEKNVKMYHNLYDYGRLHKLEKKEEAVSLDPLLVDVNTPLTIGMQVAHTMFGVGEIILIEGNGDNRMVDIHFMNGSTKTLLVSKAKLKRIEDN